MCIRDSILIAQDTTRYGIDLYGEYSLSKLLRRLCKIDAVSYTHLKIVVPEMRK